MPFAWTKELELGIEEIDEQHRELFVRAERLYHAMRHGQPIAAEAMLASFRDFVLSHFEFEERWMRRADFPGLELHRVAHREFADRLHAVTGEYRRHGPSPAWRRRCGSGRRPGCSSTSVARTAAGSLGHVPRRGAAALSAGRRRGGVAGPKRARRLT